MIYDISRTIEPDMSVYKNRFNKKPRFTWVSFYADKGVRESELLMNLHTGTHIDAPIHMLENGESVDTLAWDLFVGHARVLDLTELDRKIEADDLRKYNLQEGEIILCKTKNSLTEEFSFDFICFAPSAAEYMVESKIKAVALDAMSLESNDPEHPVHQILLGNGIGCMEDVRLAEVPEGEYNMLSLPLKISGYDAGPSRALLFTKDETLF